MKLAVILPSRGLIFSQTCEELLENLEGYDYDIFFAHGLPIPDCFNKPIEEALKGSYTHFWIVEEDMILPKNVLGALAEELKNDNLQAITCDYPVSASGKAAVYRDPERNAIYSGTGCLLMTREFLESYKKPIFRTDIAWDVKIGDRFEATPRKIKGNLYGLHDVTFGLLAYASGNPIRISRQWCGQRRLLKLGQAGTNNGEHLIASWTDLNPEVLKLPKLTKMNVKLNDDSIVYMDIKRAKELQVEGKVTVPDYGYVELVKNEVYEEL